MKKVSVVMLKAEATTRLASLAKRGLLHVEVSSHTQTPHIEELRNRMRKLASLRAALPKASRNPKKRPGSPLDSVAYEKLETRLTEDLRHSAEVDTRLRHIEADIGKWAKWGECAPALIAAVSKELELNCYLCGKKEYRESPYTWIITQSSGQCYVLHAMPRSLQSQKEEEIPESWQKLSLPKHSLAELKKEKEELRAVQRRLRDTLASMHEESAQLALEERYLEEALHFAEAQLQMGEDTELSWITGYVPEKSVPQLTKYAQREHCGILVREADSDDPVPTALSEGALSTTIQPVFDMFGTVPGYREYDFRVLFLLFFSLFFGMIVSDAGYSSIFLVITAFLSLKFLFRRQSIPRMLRLFALLSTAALLWGALSGNWFGTSSLVSGSIFSFVIFDAISIDRVESKTIIMFFCMIVGLTHLLIARIWSLCRVLRQRSLKALAELGWMATLVGLFYLVLSMVVDAQRFPVPFFAWPLILSGVAMCMLFGQQEGRFFRGILKGFGGIYTLALDAIGAFADIISYIRLYAMGLAGLEVARNFNAMASSMVAGSESIVMLILAALVLLGGHSLNIVMGLLGVAVHGIRLNMLEFTRHLGMEWNGIAYRPLRRDYAKPTECDTKEKENI